MDIKDVTDQIDPEQWKQILKAAYFIEDKMAELGYDNYVIGPICARSFAENYFNLQKTLEEDKEKEQNYGNN
jgi:hypothetical protein